MPDRRSSSRTRDLERFIRQFFFWYHVMFYKMKVVQKLFDALFERLYREEGTRYAASYAVWASRARQWNRVWRISKNARLARIPPVIPEELLEFELFPEITLEDLPQPYKMNDIQEQYIPYTTSAMSANASSGQPSDIAYDQSAEIAEHITSKACYNYSDPWQLPQNFRTGSARSIQTSSHSATPGTISAPGSFTTAQDLRNLQYSSAQTEEPMDIAEPQETWHHPIAGRRLERDPTWIPWHTDDVAAAGSHQSVPYIMNAFGTPISPDAVDGREVHSHIRNPVRRITRGRPESDDPTTL